MAAQMALTAGTRLGPYGINALIGKGGMGEVYRATDTKLKRQVAIKILPTELAANPDRIARFQREAEVLASLNHPNIAQIHGLEDGRGVQALVMEFVEGPTSLAASRRGRFRLTKHCRSLDRSPRRWKPHTTTASSTAISTRQWELRVGENHAEERLFHGTERDRGPGAVRVISVGSLLDVRWRQRSWSG